MKEQHLISVQGTATRVLQATGATLEIQIRGQSFVTGNEAFRKAAEVANCVAALREVGIDEEHIHLFNVSTNVESGLLLKSSSASYELRVECQEIETLGRVMTAISSQKNVKLRSVSWEYPDLERTRLELICQSVEAAKQTARTIADALGTPLVSVHRLSYKVSGLGTRTEVTDFVDSDEEYGYAKTKRRSRSTAALEQLSLSHVTTVEVTANAQFVVGQFGVGE